MSADIKSSALRVGANTSNRRRKRFLEMYFVRFIQCPSAVKGGGGNQRPVSEGTAITQREIWERDGGRCEGGWPGIGKGGVGKEAGGWNDGFLNEVCHFEWWLLTASEKTR